MTAHRDGHIGNTTQLRARHTTDEMDRSTRDGRGDVGLFPVTEPLNVNVHLVPSGEREDEMKF